MGTVRADLEPLAERVRVAVGARLATGYDPDDPRTGPDGAPETAWESALAGDLEPYADRLESAVALLGLSRLAGRVLALAASAELDGRFGNAFAFLADDATRRFPSPRLVAALLTGDEVTEADVLKVLAADGPLRRRGCLRQGDSDDAAALADRPIRLAPELISFLLGASLEPVSDPRILRHQAPTHPVGRAEAIERIRAAVRGQMGGPVLVAGPDAADVLAAAAGQPLLIVDARAAADAALIGRADLLAALESRVVALDRADLLGPDEVPALRALSAARDDRLLLCGATASAITRVAELDPIMIEVASPSLEERRTMWRALGFGSAADEVAAKFRLSIAQIARAADVARFEASVRGLETPGRPELEEGARRASSSGLTERAVQVTRQFVWDDLVVPQRQLGQLRSIASYIRYRDQVLSSWGYEHLTGNRQGLKVLFAGESGTGKTMAASVLAADLGLELFAIDLATVISKYVGETEQNLQRIFSAAEGSNAILFFDEADALFGKRSDVADARDRYANIEVAYLLQRMEAHPGAAILATNLKQNMDEAFLRRLDFVIDFPLPDAADRRRIWRLALPPQAPLANDVDVEFLADRFKLSGGSIRNCSLAAAFEAAAAGRSIGMAHLVRAVAAEYGKLGRLAIEADFERYHAMLGDPDAALATPDAPEASEVPIDLEPFAPAPGRTVIRSRLEEL